ncbi:hypothetical protein ESCO_004945 [Escovopsis weberi]|uniref:Uncharacterized protein n=1 Tax=Escovopsis weberi TaxID=150374 RepID=A0A0M8MR69_ESCWE|nr:hypothetical protein ESCO_004945 [Escovopsis weberi]
MKFFIALALSSLAVAIPVVVTPNAPGITPAEDDRTVHYANSVPEDIAHEESVPVTNIKAPAMRPPFKDNRNLRYTSGEEPVQADS